MPLVDHLGISVANPREAISQWDPVLSALGYRMGESTTEIFWSREGETELILYPAREPGEHVHGRMGWQHLAFSMESPAEVDRLHDIAIAAGWSAVRDPKPYPRFTAAYYASFVESDDGIRLEFMYNPPK